MNGAYKLSVRERRRLRKRFFADLGQNGGTFRDMFYELSTVPFYMKDKNGRIMAINRRNLEICNINDEWDAIGLTSSDLFPKEYADAYMTLDEEVLRTGKPVLGHITHFPADRSMSITVSNVYPLRNAAGKVIGTARTYHLAPDTDIASRRYGQIRAVTTYIDRHYAEDIRIPQLVAQTGMSETVFKQAFAKTFGMTPRRYLTTIRLNAARRLLETTDQLISEIAASTGFFDQSHLTRIFKKERGMTPGEYRRRHRD